MERAGVWNIHRWIATMLAVALLAAAVLVTGGASADARGPSRSVAAVPDGFQQQLTYMAQPRDVENPTVVNYATFEEFQAEVWGRDADDIAAFRAEAIEFYYERFGLDFSDAVIDEYGVQTITDPGTKMDVTLTPSFVAPETEYRAYTIGGRWTPPEGYVVRDSSFNVMLPPRIELGGDYGGDDGKVAADGGLLAFGDYSILIPGPGNSGNDETIDIRFLSTGPIVANADGAMTFICDLESERWGSGQARGIVTPNGEIRNVLTFPSTS
ncbi:MAG: hypothetical protein ACNA8R_05265 [Nitriliruptoraceae bacterium]